MRALWRTIGREMEIIAHSPLRWIACIGLPLFAAFFMATIFGEGVMRELPIAVVDNDFSPSSRALVRTIDASPMLHITHHPTTTSEALASLRKGEIFGYVVLPRDFERDTARGTHTTLAYYYHYALMSVGATVESALRQILTMATLAPVVVTAQEMGVGEERVEHFVEAVESDLHPLGNPTLNFCTYLSVPFFFIMFQIIILLTVVYIFGSEVNSSSAREWLAVADGNIFTASLGKLLPYTAAFVASGVGGICIMHTLSAVAWQSSVGMLVGDMVLLVVASTSLALFLFSLMPIMGLVISGASMIGSLGATLSGITFPLTSMYPLFRIAALALPIRHFTLITQNGLYGSGEFALVWWNYAALVGFALLPLLTLPRLRRAVISRRYEKTL